MILKLIKYCMVLGLEIGIYLAEEKEKKEKFKKQMEILGWDVKKSKIKDNRIKTKLQKKVE